MPTLLDFLLHSDRHLLDLAVASPVGANAEVVTQGSDGFLASDQKTWEETLVELIGDPAARAQVGTAGRARVETAYSLPAVLPRYLAVIGSLRNTN